MAQAQLPERERFDPLGQLRPHRMCAPLQQTLEDVPTIELEIAEVLDEDDNEKRKLYQRFEDFTEQRFRRLKRIGPGTYYGKPILPHPNPANNRRLPHLGHSYHSIILTCRDRPDLRVHLLIRDFDLYLLGFRRELDEVWSPWYYCKNDLGFPVFLDNVEKEELDFDGGHEKKGNMGGTQTLLSIFNALGKYPDKRDYNKMKKAFLQAVVLFCEAMRFTYILAELVRRIKDGVEDSPMDIPPVPAGRFWKRVGSWVVFSHLALGAGLSDGWVSTRRLMKDYDTIYLINGFMDMLNGLKVLKILDQGSLTSAGLTVEYGLGVAEPDFIGLHEEYAGA
ncbi:hypothetical protein ACQ4PT_006107 [Festuca glaucescens]